MGQKRPGEEGVEEGHEEGRPMIEGKTTDNRAGKPKVRRPGGKTKRGDGKWLLRIFRGYDAHGKRIYYSEIFHGGSREADDHQPCSRAADQHLQTGGQARTHPDQSNEQGGLADEAEAEARGDDRRPD